MCAGAPAVPYVFLQVCCIPLMVCCIPLMHRHPPLAAPGVPISLAQRSFECSLPSLKLSPPSPLPFSILPLPLHGDTDPPFPGLPPAAMGLAPNSFWGLRTGPPSASLVATDLGGKECDPETLSVPSPVQVYLFCPLDLWLPCRGFPRSNMCDYRPRGEFHQ